VTPTLNQAGFIRETIESVLGQDHPGLEYIVVDGGSTDGTRAILQSYQDRLRFVSHPGEGQAASINAGFAMASGQVLAWINSDDRYREGAVSRAAGFLGAHPEIDVMYGGCGYIDARGEPLAVYPTGAPDFPRWIETIANGIPQPAAFARRSALESVGFLDPSLDFVLDFDLWLRLALEERTFAYVDATLADLRLHDGAKSVRALTGFASELQRCYERVLTSPRLPPGVRQDRAWSNLHYRAAQLLFWGGDTAGARDQALQAVRCSPFNVRPTLLYALAGRPARGILDVLRGNPFRLGMR
jgi:glycosyltransferase involved in cell wall biosynthesis